MEAGLLEAAIKGLVAAGPVATILGVVCYALWKQNIELIRKLDRQHDKMLKLAVRVQRAVEALAGIENNETEIEQVLDDEEHRARDKARDKARDADRDRDRDDDDRDRDRDEA